jgi:hypothetical protein
MKAYIIFLLLLVSVNAFADYKIITGKNAIKLPPLKIANENLFETKGYTYPEGEFVMLNDNSFEIGSIEDSNVNGGVFYKEYLDGDFIATFETDEWRKRSSGVLGIVIERNGVLTRLIEVASYSAYGDGCPFTRVFNPYRYNSPVCNFDEKYRLLIKKENGIIYSEVKDLSSGRIYSQSISSGNSNVQVGVYFMESANSDYDKKVVRNFTVEKL